MSWRSNVERHSIRNLFSPRPGDILLIEGDSRVSAAIRYLTQSTWSHAALYVGRIIDRHEPDGEPHVLVEAELDEGVISSPLSKYRQAHSRICRPVGLATEDIEAVVSFAVERIGFTYNLKNIVDLVRYLLPTPPVPVRFRRRMIALGAGSPTRAICSTLIAQAFHSIRYPILPQIEIAEDNLAKLQSEYARVEILHIRSHTLFTPHDFDISPYFSVIKPMIEAGFDYRTLTWAEESIIPNGGASLRERSPTEDDTNARVTFCNSLTVLTVKEDVDWVYCTVLDYDL